MIPNRVIIKATLIIGPREYPTQVRKNHLRVIETLVFINKYWSVAVINPIISAGRNNGEMIIQISPQAWMDREWLKYGKMMIVNGMAMLNIHNPQNMNLLFIDFI